MSTSNKTPKTYPTFINNSGLPINLETFQNSKNVIGVDEMVEILVKPGEKVIMPSTNGEWYLNNYFNITEGFEEWRKAGIRAGESVGKFRDKPCVRGNYSWMEHDNSPFDIVYDSEKCTATFIKK